MGRFTSGGVIYEELPDGNARVVGYENQTIGPVDPSLQFEAPKASADARRAAADASVAEAEAPYAASIAAAQAQKAQADAQKAAIEAERARAGEEESDKVTAARRILELLDDEGGIQEQYDQSFKGGGIPGLNEYNPLREANEKFDKSANVLLPFARKLLRTPGEGSQSDAENKAWTDLLPKSTNRDATNEQLIADLRSTALDILATSGVDVSTYNPASPETRGNAWTTPRITEGGAPKQAAGFGATTQRQDIPPAYQQAHDAFIAASPQGLDPEAYARFRSALDEQFGLPPDPDAYRAWANEATKVLQQGGTINRTVPGPEVPMGMLDQVRNNMATAPLGAALAGAADMGSFGGVSALAGDQMDALRDEQFLPMLAGEIGGAITGTGMLGRAGREITKRALPPRQAVQVLRGGEGRGQFLRDLLTDTTFGGLYGGISEGDPLTGAAAAGIGSALGQGAGKTLGSLVGGVSGSAPVQTLRDAGVRMTTGQRLGGIPKTIEDAMTSMPGVGSMVTARRMEGLEDFNRAAFREAGDPQAQNIGEAGIANLQDNVVPQAYGQALSGQQFQLDPQLRAAGAQRAQQAAGLPSNIADETRNAMRQSMDPFIDQAGNFTGQDMQRMYQNLQRRSSKFDKLPDPSGMDGAEVLRGLLGDLGDTVNRQAPDVMPAFQDANTTYMRSKILEDAVSRGINTEGMFTPAQLGMAARASGKKFGGTQARPERQFFDLQRAGQDVLPSNVPDSGTPLRSLLAGGALTGTGAGLGALAGGQEGAATGAGTTLTLGALLALMGTRRGQQSLNTLLFDRPFRAQQLGDFIKRNSDFLGSGAVPLAITAE